MCCQTSEEAAGSITAKTFLGKPPRRAKRAYAKARQQQRLPRQAKRTQHVCVPSIPAGYKRLQHPAVGAVLPAKVRGGGRGPTMEPHRCCTHQREGKGRRRLGR